jgi:hypothetical protein
MKLQKTLKDYEKTCYKLLTNLSEEITFSQLTTLIQEIYCIENYTEISAAIHILVYSGFLHEITAPNYIIQLKSKKTKELTHASIAINEKMIDLVNIARENAPASDYCYTDRYPISLQSYLDYIKQEHTGLLKGNHAQILLSRMNYYCDYYINEYIGDDIKNPLDKLFSGHKNFFRLKTFDFDREQISFTLTLYILPQENKNTYPNCHETFTELEKLLHLCFKEEVKIQIKTEKI